MNARLPLVILKRVILLMWSAELWLRRRMGPAWRRRFWELAGACQGCGACCVEPTIHAGPIVWHLSVVRWWFLRWQRWANGFELTRHEPASHDLVFRCARYDPVSHRCHRYADRPNMCRDYPTVLLGQAWPELFASCGYRVRARKPECLRAGIEATSLSSEAKAELRRKLRID